MKRFEHLLTILGEEGAEVTQRAAKVLRFGILEVEPGQSINNGERLLGEVNDVLAMCEMIGLPYGDRAAIEAKKVKVEKFLLYSKTCGTLDE